MIFKQIKALLTIRQVLGFYGVKLKGRKAICPFHQEKTASLFIYEHNRNDETFQCMGCNKGGDIIVFTRHMFGLNKNIDAIKKLDHDFRLGLIKEEISKEDKAKWKRYKENMERKMKQQEEKENERHNLLEVIGSLDKIRIKHKPRKYEAITNEFIFFTNEFNEACMMYEYKFGAIN